MEPSFEKMGASELVQGSIADSRELVRLEVALAKDELLQELHATKAAAICAAASMVLGLAAIACFIVAAGIALGPAVMGISGGALLLAAAGVGFIGVHRMPRALMASTVERLETDKETLKEHLS